MEAYFSTLEEGTRRAYEVAGRARQVGLDPETKVEIPQARDLASRVEELLAKWHVEGVAKRIRELSSDPSRPPREMVALRVAEEIALDESRGSRERRLDVALRVGLAIVTEGILVAPLEGLVATKIREDAGGPYVDLYYAGPIRAAGGTAQAVSVLMADVVRRKLGLASYRPTPDEIGRYKEEIPLYKHVQHLQYLPSAEEIEQVVAHVPVCINGEKTEEEEVTAFRNLPRVDTPGIRGGACLVIAEGICLKAAKLRGIVKTLGLDGWEFLDKVGSRTVKTEDGEEKHKYLAEAVGGRPILGHPNRPGGFRMVYGRARTSGLAATALNPASMVVVRDFVAIGTQLKTDFPGKAAAVSSCDTIEGPLVLLDDGSFVAVHEVHQARELLPRIRSVVDLGEMLVAAGEFLENNHRLVPGAYSLPWHVEVARKAGLDIGPRILHPTFAEALEDARTYGLPLHPKYNLFWHDIDLPTLRALSMGIEATARWSEGLLVLPADTPWKSQLLALGVLHGVRGNELRIEPALAEPFLAGLGLETGPEGLRRRDTVDLGGTSTLAEVSRLTGALIKARSPTRIGVRVGRPEKARHRDMSPAVHSLFPIEMGGGPQRSITKLAKDAGGGSVNVTVGLRTCPSCGLHPMWSRCTCGAHTEPTGKTVNASLAVGDHYRQAIRNLGLTAEPPLVKGVRGLMSRGKTPEILEKGILRALHKISVYADGTTRFDLTDIPLTHFRPSEIGLSVERARSLGYERDWTSEPLVSPDQVLELRPQDLVLSTKAADYLLSISQFVDDELQRIYSLEPFYQARGSDDLLGHLVIALAPHTSGGVLGRIIGFTDVEGCFAHPAFHASKRRNCDGDEDSVTLLLDGLLNFSFAFLPETRGGYMDKPLVLTTRLDAREVDKEAHNVDVAPRYPIEFYEAAEAQKSPKDVEALIDTVKKRLEDPARHFQGYAFTHDTTDIALGPLRSAYRDSMGMQSVVDNAVAVMSQIRAVDLGSTITSVLDHHFLPDILGNMRSYATQKFRCQKCGAEYRRLPLVGQCTAAQGQKSCGGNLLPTVYEGAVTKYLDLSKELSSHDGVGQYVKQRVAILESSLEALFPTHQRRLSDFRPDGPEPDSTEN